MNIKLINKVEFENPIQQILHNRGIDDMEKFFNINWKTVQDPRALDNIEAGAEMLEKHIRNNSKITILVDCDADGFTSAAILLNYLREQLLISFPGSTPEFSYLFHNGKDHGLDDTEVMRRIRDEFKPDLLIIPDASGKPEQYQALIDLNIEILVLDHHDTEIIEMPHLVVINSYTSKNYNNKALSGAGVVWQFCSFLDEIWNDINCARYLDLVAIGLVGDVMDLSFDETRFLVFQGLATQESNFVDTAKFKLSYNLKDKYNPHSIGFVISPLFNAICRIGSMEEKDIAFKALLNNESSSMVKDGTRGHTGEVTLACEALRQMTNAKSRQDSRRKKLNSKIIEVIHERRLDKNKIILIQIDDFDKDQRALSGVLANSLQELYQRPVILIYKSNEDTYTGSTRAPESIEAFANFKDQCNESGLVMYASGHQQAFGIGIKSDKIEEFINYFNKKYETVETTPCYAVDYVFDINDPTAAEKCLILTELEDFYGTGIKEPLVVFKNVPLKHDTMALFKPEGPCPTLKITANGISFIKFYSSQDEFNSLKIPYDGGPEQFYTATIVGTCEANNFRGATSLQINIVDYDVNVPMYNF